MTDLVNLRPPTLPLPQHLLVRLPNPLGDAVLATPALRALRHALPGRRITWAGRPAGLRALEGLPYRDAVVPSDPMATSGRRAPRRAGKTWRRLAPDAVLVLPHSWSAAVAARGSAARTRVGGGRGGTGALLTHVVPLPEERGRLEPRSMIRMYLDLAAPFGARDDGRGPEVVAQPFDRRRAHARLASAGSGARFLAVNPGAAFGPSKIYPPELLSVAVRRIREVTGSVPLILCGPGEEALAREIAERVGDPAVSTHDHPPDLGELKGLLARSRLLLTVDAGPRHLAEALGTPTVVIMGPTDPRWTEQSTAILVRKEGLDCLACHRPRCPIDHPCMRTLDPVAVADACLRSVRGERAGPSAAPRSR